MPRGEVKIPLPSSLVHAAARHAEATGQDVSTWVADVVAVRLAEERCRHRPAPPSSPRPAAEAEASSA